MRETLVELPDDRQRHQMHDEMSLTPTLISDLEVQEFSEPRIGPGSRGKVINDPFISDRA